MRFRAKMTTFVVEISSSINKMEFSITCTEPESSQKSPLNCVLEPITPQSNPCVARGCTSVPRRVLNSAANLLPRNNRDAVWGAEECGGAR